MNIRGLKEILISVPDVTDTNECQILQENMTVIDSTNDHEYERLQRNVTSDPTVTDITK